MSEPSERTNQSFRSQFAQASHVQEFVPRNRSTESLPRQRQCSHQSSHSDHTICQLDQLLNTQTTTPPTPSLKDETSESLSSGGSSSSLHTQSTNTGLGGWYGKGQGWIQSPVWTPPVATPVRAKPAFTVRSDRSARGSQQSDEDYHLVSMADKFVDEHDQHQGHVDKDPMFNPSLARLSFSTPPRASHAALYPSNHHHTQPSRSVLDSSQLSPDQIATFVASFSAAPSTQSPLVKQLVARATRLAQGITKPPPNRGFRAKANEAPDNDETNTTVFVGGLSEGVTESLLNDIFAPFGSITYVSPPLSHLLSSLSSIILYHPSSSKLPFYPFLSSPVLSPGLLSSLFVSFPTTSYHRLTCSGQGTSWQRVWIRPIQLQKGFRVRHQTDARFRMYGLQSSNPLGKEPK